MKIFSFFRLFYTLIFSILIVYAYSAPAIAAVSNGTMQEIVSELITTFDLSEPVEIKTANLELAQKKVYDVLEKHDSVLEFEISISAPDKRLICTPFLSKKLNTGWRFLVLYQATPASRIVGYNLSNNEFKKIIENLYNVSMYHFDPEG